MTEIARLRAERAELEREREAHRARILEAERKIFECDMHIMAARVLLGEVELVEAPRDDLPAIIVRILAYYPDGLRPNALAALIAELPGDAERLGRDNSILYATLSKMHRRGQLGRDSNSLYRLKQAEG